MTGAITLTIWACLASQPGECRSWPLTFAEQGLSPKRCVMGAQPVMAEWAGQHPAWTIRRYWCSTMETAGQGI